MTRLSAAGRRLAQGLTALFAFAIPIDEDAARAVLSPALFALWGRMTRSERLHSLRVLRDLQADGHSNPDLLTAALLHDVGKSRHGMTLVGRTLVVLTGRFAPRLAERLAARDAPRGLVRPFVIKRRHAEWSAQDMAAAGASQAAVALARHHQAEQPPPGELGRKLRLLQAADERS